jgi:hypothetical protein
MNQTEQKTITITISIDALNVILAGLSELPHRVSDSIITGLKNTAIEQLEKKQVDSDDKSNE